MDYGKVSAILIELYDNKDFMVSSGYLPIEYFTQLEDGLVLTRFVDAGWAEPTELGKTQIDLCWNVLCDLHELDKTVMYDDIMAFWKAQGVEFSESKTNS